MSIIGSLVLANIAIPLLFCTRSAESFESARRERLKVSGNPVQYKDLSLFTDEQRLKRLQIGWSRQADST